MQQLASHNQAGSSVAKVRGCCYQQTRILPHTSLAAYNETHLGVPESNLALVSVSSATDVVAYVKAEQGARILTCRGAGLT